MRRVFRLIGTIRFAIGTAIVLIAFVLRSDVGEVWTGILILLGAVVGVSGVTSGLLLISYYFILPFGYIGVIWLTSEIWDGASYSDVLRQNYGYLYFFWAVGLFVLPLIFYQHNKSWFFMTKKFSLDVEPADTQHPELFAVGVVDLTGSPYLAAATITEQGLILDRRNFDPVILPWHWVLSIEPDSHADPRSPTAVVAMRNDDNDYLTLSVPWNEELLELNSARLARG